MKIIILALAVSLALSGCVSREAYTMGNGVQYDAIYLGDNLVRTNYLEDAYAALDEGATVTAYGLCGPVDLIAADEEYMYGESSYIPIAEAGEYFTEYWIRW